MNKSILLAGLASLLIGGGVFVGCSSDSDDGSGGSGNSGNEGGSGAEGAAGPGNGGTGPGNGGAGPGNGGAGQGGAGVGGGGEQLGCNAPADVEGLCGAIAAPSVCNPVTNEGCADGSACDNEGTSFQCFDDPTEATLCEECNLNGGPFCQPTQTCLFDGTTGTCARYCCDDADCGDGTCVKVVDGAPFFDFAPNVGFCF